MQHKFRAFDRKTNTMLSSCDDYTVWVGGKEASINGKIYGKEHAHLTIPYEDVMQFTGFHAGGIVDEKNEIYDSAILSVNHYNKDFIGVVYFDLNTGSWNVRFNNCIDTLCDSYKDAKIIGSAQENPELLEDNNAT